MLPRRYGPAWHSLLRLKTRLSDKSFAMPPVFEYQSWFAGSRRPKVSYFCGGMRISGRHGTSRECNLVRRIVFDVVHHALPTLAKNHLPLAEENAGLSMGCDFTLESFALKHVRYWHLVSAIEWSQTCATLRLASSYLDGSSRASPRCVSRLPPGISPISCSGQH
jgi:hypothetical protein